MYNILPVDPDTWAFEMVMEDGDVCRFFVLDGEEYSLMIDSGLFPIDVKTMASDLLKQAGRDKTRNGGDKSIILANTHGDRDHVGGNGCFDSFYLTQADFDQCGIRDLYPDASFIPAEEGTEIHLGGRTLRYILTPGHTYGNAALLDVQRRILFAGDIIQTGHVFLFGDHRCPEMYKESLRKLQAIKGDYDRIYANHGQTVLSADAVDQAIMAWDQVLQKKVLPKSIEVMNCPVDEYQCGFCSFYCNPEE